MDVLKSLEELGMTNGEARVYLALLEEGRSTVGPVIKSSRISPSKVYDVLHRLVKKGIVTSVIGGKTRFYSALPPQRLKIMINDRKDFYQRQLKQQEKALSELIPLLEFHQEKVGQKEYAEIMEGVSGIKSFFEMLIEEMKPGETALQIGYSKYAGDLLDEYFNEYNNRMLKKGIRSMVIFEHDAWFRKKRHGRSHATYRYLPKKLKTSAFASIFHDKVGIMIATEKQKLCILIRNQEIADSYREYFRFMWRHSIKPASSYRK